MFSTMRRYGGSRLFFTFYLWFLLALTLTVGSAAGFFALWSERGWEERGREIVLRQLGLARDLAELVAAGPGGWDEVERRLRPALEREGVTLTIARADGAPLLNAAPSGAARDTAPGAAPAAVVPLAPGVAGEILTRGEYLNWRHHGAVAAGLPIRLPSGEQGVFLVQGGRPAWGERGGGRFFIGLALILAVAALLCWPLAAHLAHPLRRLAATADRLGQGDLTARITMRRRDEIGTLAHRINAMAGNLQRLVAGQKQLLADISHELRSPLARLGVALELARGKSGAEAHPYLDKIERQAADLDALIEELLSYSRLDALPQPPARERIEARALLAEVTAAHAPQSEAKGVRVETRAAEGLPPLSAEPRLIARALGNALRNALAHAPQGSVVTIEARPEPGAILLTVRDQGPGVEPALLQRIFEPFVRGDPARGRRPGDAPEAVGTAGSGLGLAIARRALEAHGGTAWAENLIGPDGARAGFIVKFWLPEK